MQIRPRYDGPPAIVIDGAPDDQREPLVRQRRRLHDLLVTLTDEQWRSPSRCDEWSAQDVVNHLIGTNQFWHGSMASALAGSPTRFLEAFDPAATPSLMVEPMRALSPAQTLERLAATTEAMFEVVDSLDDEGWCTLAESPPGHVPIRLLAAHALWDSWIHERDIALPLGLAPAEEPDEVRSSLRYVAALGPALAGGGRHGALVVDATEPDDHFVVEAEESVHVHGGVAPEGALTLSGRAVDLVEQLSMRAPASHHVPDQTSWLLGGLAEIFDISTT
jgi:uncharacterized protein (TIGR03083 family)